MHVVVAPDKFKGSLTAREVADRVAAGIDAVEPGLAVVRVPVADGGDGTVDAALAAGYERVPLRATGPTGDRSTPPTRCATASRWSRWPTSPACGCCRRTGSRRSPRPPTARVRSSGPRSTGAAAASCSASAAARARTAAPACWRRSASGCSTPPGTRCPAAAARSPTCSRVDLAGLHPAVAETRIVVACDVDNPLLGPHGAAAVYGPQKGASPDDVRTLDAALAHWADLVDAATGRAGVRDRAGAGAAGGVGYAAMAVLGAELEPGIGLILDLVRFADHLPGASLVITGEGSLDEQTLHGKAPAGVASAAAKAGIPVVTVSGRLALDAEQLQAAGIDAAYALTDIEPDVRRCVADAGPLLEKLAQGLARERIGGTNP